MVDDGFNAHMDKYGFLVQKILTVMTRLWLCSQQNMNKANDVEFACVKCFSLNSWNFYYPQFFLCFKSLKFKAWIVECQKFIQHNKTEKYFLR